MTEPSPRRGQVWNSDRSQAGTPGRATSRQRSTRHREVEELDCRYTEGYRKKPEDLTWAESVARLLAHLLPREKW